MGQVDQDQEHGDLTVGLSGKSRRGGLPAGLFALVSRSPVGASLLAMTASAAMKYLALFKQEAASVYGRFSAVLERARIAP